MRMGHVSRRILAIVVLGGLLAAALLIAPAARRFLAEDRCLDAGGVWLDAEKRCEGARAGG
jgi:hypothetical protein